MPRDRFFKLCLNCNKSYFLPPSQNKRSKYCSLTCWRENKKKVTLICKCGNPFVRDHSRRLSGKYCSKHCAGIFNNNLANHREHSAQTRRKISESFKGNTRGLGWKMPLKQKLELSRSRKGVNSPLWRGGATSKNMLIRSGLEYRLWRIAVFTRDDYQCVLGGKDHGSNLQADHIKPFALFPEFRFAIDNGRTLCVNCHKQTDTYLAKMKNYERSLNAST